MSVAVATVALLRAHPHQWGLGFVHQIDEERDKLLCGKTPASCPGTKYRGSPEEITCKACLRSIEAKADQERRRQEWALREQEREEERELWRDLYDQYLDSDEWLTKRARVLKRAGGICEGCGERRAVQVHHTRYPRDCWPGSAQWLAQEKLFDLRAVCIECHNDIHNSGEAV